MARRSFIEIIRDLFDPIRRAIRRAPLTPIADMRPGIRWRGVGIVEELDDMHLSAPITGRRCVAYDVVVIKRTSKDTYKAIERRSEHLEFLVADQTGSVIVPKGPTRFSVAEVVFKNADSPDLASHRIRDAAIFEERIVPAGLAVTFSGACSTNSVEQGPRRLVATNDEPVLIADIPNHSRLPRARWLQGR